MPANIPRIRHAQTEESFLKAIRAHPDNAYIDTETSASERPLYYTFTCGAMGISPEAASQFEHFFMRTKSKKIIAAATIRTEDSGDIHLLQISVHPRHQRKGYARALAKHVMGLASERNTPLTVGSFQERDLSFVNMFSDLHRSFPDLIISYGSCDGATLQGDKPYIIKHAEYGDDFEITSP